MNNLVIGDFDFDDWVALYRSDPTIFEELRRTVVESFIEEWPSQHREVGYALQREIDWVRQCAKNSEDSIKKVYGMLSDHFEFLIETTHHLGAEIAALQQLNKC